MATEDSPLTAGSVTIAVEDPTSDDAGFCLTSYFAELGQRFDNGFDINRTLPFDTAELVEPNGLLLVARLSGAPIGCAAIKFSGTEPAYIKRMWVSSSARGLGVARRMLTELEQLAAAHGTAVTRLETNRALHEAIALYRSAGYRAVEPFNDEPYAHHWFEKRLAT